MDHHHRHHPLRRCTTMSTVDSTSPELFNRTCGIVSDYTGGYFSWVASLELLSGAAKSKKGKGSPYSIAERRVPELIPVLGSQP